jgi:ATP/maltotriose-dependent transcriptional regulator MalT/DNA-binding SARP family transcriptional activator
MNRSVSISKITPPYLPPILYRPRLLELLENNKDKKLILILGQAAQGKTTLIASYVKNSKIPSVWLNLDQSESDPINLFHLIVKSLQHVLKDIDLSPLLNESNGLMNPRPMVPLFRDGADFISKNVPHSIQLVLDGVDRLFHDPLPFQCLQAFMEGLSPNVHVIMLSRGTPPPSFEFQHLKIRQEALILTNEDLAFTQNEVKEFFRKIKRIPLDEDQSRKIYTATEGWVGGLILLSESLLRLPGPSRQKYLAEELPGFFNKDFFQYFGKEILSSQPMEAQQFLIKSSLMDIIEPSFAKEVFEIENPEGILRDHTRRNLFVQSFYDEKKGWLFRYHHMFRNFLKAKYIADTTSEERHALTLKIGNLYKQKGDLEGAIKYFLEAKAYPQATSIIEPLGMDLLRKGRKSDLASWIYALPDDLVQKNPWLLFYLTMTRQFMAGEENVISFEKAYQLFKENGERKGELICLAQLISTIIQTGIHLFPIHPLIQNAEFLLGALGADAYKYERATLWNYIGQAYLLVEGDIRKGIQTCEHAFLISKQIRDIPLQARALLSCALGFIYVGEFSRAEEALKKIEAFAEKFDYQKELKMITMMVNCLLANAQGDFEKAHHLNKELQMGIEKYGFISIAPWVYEITAYLKLTRGDLIDAEEIANRYLSVTRSLKNDFLKGLALRLLGLIYLHQKDFRKAAEAIDRSIEAFSNEAPSRYHLQRDKIISGLISHEIHEVEKGEKELVEALQYFSSISSYNSLVETHLCLSFLKWDQNKRKEASLHLQTGFKMMAEKRYKHLHILGSIYLIKALLLALELKIDGPTDYIVNLLATLSPSTTEEELKKLSSHPDLRVRKRVEEIRRTIHRSNIPPLRIETLGQFQIYRGDSLIREEEWDRSQPKKILKAIVSYSGHMIPKEILIDELWPEERPKAAEKNFKTTLQRLRKSLEPSIHKDFSSSYIHLHDNVVSLDPDLCQEDSHLFLSLLKKAEEKEKRGDKKGALPLYTEAMEIYKGDFLPEELYAPWVDKRREELRGKYIELLSKVAGLYERQGAFKKSIDCYKKAIQVDPLLEEPYQKLMTFYSSKGMNNEALRIYEDCKKVLKKELKTKPDSKTTAIYNKVLEKIGSPQPAKRKGSDKKK